MLADEVCVVQGFGQAAGALPCAVQVFDDPGLGRELVEFPEPEVGYAGGGTVARVVPEFRFGHDGSSPAVPVLPGSVSLKSKPPAFRSPAARWGGSSAGHRPRA